MPTALQFRRGTTTQNNSFTGALGEISVDTTLDVLRVHDGASAGGFAMVSETAAQTLTNKTLTSPVINTGTFGTSILPVSADGTSLGSATKEFSDLFLADAGTIQFGNDQEVRIIHNADKGLILKHTATADDKPIILTLQTGETDMAANDVMGKIEFQAPDEGTGTDAILVAAAIQAVSEGDFSASSNATRLEFHTGASEAASSKMTLSSAGLLTIADDFLIKDGGTIGVASTVDALTISSAGIVTFKDDILIKDGGTIGAASAATAITIASTGIVTFVDDILIKDNGTIGSATVANAIAIGSDGDITLTQDLELQHDGATVSFGANDEVVLTHNHNKGLILKHTATADDKPVILTLQTGETDMAANDVMGKIEFQAPDEGTGTDAILVAAAIQARSEGDFSASANATSLDFMTGASEAAATKMSLTSGGDVNVLTDGASIFFGASSEIELRHVADDGLILKHVGTGDGKEPSLTFQAGDNDIAANDLLGSIQFQAPDEGAGTDAIVVSAAIAAQSEGDFSASANATSLIFQTGASEVAATKMTLSSAGNLDVTGDITGSTLNADGDTAAGDNAAIGYTAAEGLILTGQGSTNDVTIKNDADADVLEIPTGTVNVTMAGTLDVVGDITGSTLNADGDTSAGDNAAIGYTAALGLILTGQGSTNDVTIVNDADATVLSVPTGTTNVTLAGELLVTGQVTTGFGETVFDAPPFVPGFQENIGVYVLDNHTIFDEDRIANVGTNTFIWETDTDNSSALTAAVGTDLLTGGYTLATGGTDGHQTAIATAGTPFTCASGKPWWIKTRFNLNDHDGVEFFFGLTERAADVDSWHLTSAGAGTDRVGFVKAAHNNDAITFAAAKNAGGTISTALDTAQTYDADLSVVSLGIHWDGSNIKFYANKVATTATPGDMALVHTYNTAAGIPDDSNMRLCLLVETGTGAVSTARIEYIKGAYTK